MSPLFLQAEEIRKVSKCFSGKKSGISYYNKKFSYSWVYSAFDDRKTSKWIGGDSNEPPRYVVKSITLELNGKKVVIPQEAYWDFYDPQVQGAAPFVVEDSKFLYLCIHLSDGAGSARVYLKFSDGEYKGREIRQLHNK